MLVSVSVLKGVALDAFGKEGEVSAQNIIWREKRGRVGFE